jgi:hypothetical protein
MQAMPQVMAWLSAGASERRDNKSNGCMLDGLKRRTQIALLQKELGLRMDAARGVVTKLKQKKLIS